MKKMSGKTAGKTVFRCLWSKKSICAGKQTASGTEVKPHHQNPAKSNKTLHLSLHQMPLLSYKLILVTKAEFNITDVFWLFRMSDYLKSVRHSAAASFLSYSYSTGNILIFYVYIFLSDYTSIVQSVPEIRRKKRMLRNTDLM